ncbi:MAG: PIG-L family deacetylase [Sphingobacterium sp.]
MINKALLSLLLIASTYNGLFAQQATPSSILKHRVEKLSTLGTALYFAAHPDDENTRLIAWLANEKNYRTAYLSLTRGDGGQNLIGTEQGVELGLIRTQELLAARTIDKGEQFFSAAYDFGFSKTDQETFSFWQKQEILKEAVYIIRKLQPDVIITRFPPDSRGGHGHHQASAILAREAYIAAADPLQFPEQLMDLKPWKAKRLVWNTANFGGMNNTSDDQLKIVLEDYNPLLGASYGEISANSRSQHKSQGFGAASNRGTITEFFEHVEGTEAKDSLFDGINTSWDRLDQNTEAVQTMIKTVQQTFDVNRPAKSIPALIELHSTLEKLTPNVYRQSKLKEIEDLIAQSAGLVLESVVSKPNHVVDEAFAVRHEAIFRDPSIVVKIKSINGESVEKTLNAHKTEYFEGTMTSTRSTQPYWLQEDHSLGKYQVSEGDFGRPENTDAPVSLFELEINGKAVQFQQPVQFRFVDPVKGEVHQPISISPKLTASLNTDQALLKGSDTKSFTIEINNRSAQPQQVELGFEHQSTLTIEPQTESFSIPAHQRVTHAFNVTPGQTGEQAIIRPILNGDPAQNFRKITHAHIPDITWFPPVELQIAAVDIQVPLTKVGYVNGAGDLIPSALKNLGVTVEELSGNQVKSTDLTQFDAIILGVRAYNVLEDISSWFPSLLQYVEAGGTVLVQYNVNTRLQTEKLGPYPFSLSRARVTQEDAKVAFTDPDDPVLNYPNKIKEQDFQGWIQERGLYFAAEIAPEYRTPISMADENESQHPGSLLIARHGKGKFVYTSISFFRQLPAGIPGAYRLFVNLLSNNENN